MVSKQSAGLRFCDESFTQTQERLSVLKSSLPKAHVELLAREVLKRLSESKPLPAAANDTKIPANDEIEWLAKVLMDDDPAPAREYIQVLHDDGHEVEHIYLFYLAAAARHMGAMWDDDRVPFTDVTRGAGRIYAIMRGLRPAFLSPHLVGGRTAAFASVPGETHTLGVSMAADLFRKNGWDVALELGLDHDDLVAALATDARSVIGLSCGGRHSLTALARLIVALRINAPRALILVSGRVAVEAADLVALTEPDCIVADIPAAEAEIKRFEQMMPPKAMN